MRFVPTICNFKLYLHTLVGNGDDVLLGAVVGVLYIGHTHDGIGHSVVDHRVHGHSHAVLGQKLK